MCLTPLFPLSQWKRELGQIDEIPMDNLSTIIFSFRLHAKHDDQGTAILACEGGWTWKRTRMIHNKLGEPDLDLPGEATF